MSKTNKFTVRVVVTQSSDGLNLVVNTTPKLSKKTMDKQDSFELLQTMVFANVRSNMDALMSDLGEQLNDDDDDDDGSEDEPKKESIIITEGL